MTADGYRDRLARLDDRAKILLSDLRHLPTEHANLVGAAWAEARKSEPAAVPGELAAAYASRLDAALCLLERLLRPSTWLNEWALWFDRARQCLFDAVGHAADVLGAPPVAAPILAIEPIDSPLYYPRASGRASWMPLATPADLPLPVVVCPGNHLEEPWEWSSLFHELGHHFDAAFGDSERLTNALLARDDLDTAWFEWVRECVADLYAGVLGGEQAVDAIGGALGSRVGGSSTHPPDTERKAVLRAAWNGLIGHDATPATATAAIVAPLLVGSFARWQSVVRAPATPAPRLVPGHLAALRAEGRGPNELRRVCADSLAAFPPRAWQTRPELLATLAHAMRHLVETRVLPGGAFWKVPPIPLLVRHERIALVGASHGQLLAQLQEALPLRSGRPYAMIELFALDDTPLARLLVGQKSSSAAIAERDASLRALRRFFAEHGIPCEMHLYRDPYFFASYWDAEENESRAPSDTPAHIHVSHALWGGEPRSAPSDDYEAPAGAPLPLRMRQLVDALAALRLQSSPFH